MNMTCNISYMWVKCEIGKMLNRPKNFSIFSSWTWNVQVFLTYMGMAWFMQEQAGSRMNLNSPLPWYWIQAMILRMLLRGLYPHQQCAHHLDHQQSAELHLMDLKWLVIWMTSSSCWRCSMRVLAKITCQLDADIVVPTFKAKTQAAGNFFTWKSGGDYHAWYKTPFKNTWHNTTNGFF